MLGGIAISSKTVRGAAWTILTGIFSRGLGLVGTLALTHFLAPEVQGEVSDAFIITLTAQQLSTPGTLHYLVAKPKAGPEVGWNITVLHVMLGLVASILVVVFRDPLGHMVGAPEMGKYVPGFAVALMLERVGLLPERVLARRLQFRPIGVTRTATEIVYSLAAVGLAWAGFGGMAIVWGNIARNALYVLMLVRAADRRDWLTPSPLEWKVLKPVLAFGLPLWLGAVASFASRRWDNLVVSAIFGVGVVGQYNLAYNLADIPAIQVGEQIGEVLLPSFANMTPEQRKDALIRSTGLLALIIFPLAIGLGAIAHTLVATLLHPKWAGVAPMLVILSALSVVRPFGFTMSSYLQASNMPKTVMALNVAKVFLLVPCIAVLGIFGGPLWGCVGVGVAFAVQSLSSTVVVARKDSIKVGVYLWQCVPPLVACAPLVGAVLGTRWLLARGGIDVRGVNLILEVIAGGIAYAVAAPIIARSTSRELIGLVREAIRRRRGGGRASDPPPSARGETPAE